MYTIKDIASFSGIDSTRLRNWQSRYQFLSPLTPNGSKYSEESVIRSVNLSVLVKNGWRISKALKLSSSELVRAVDSIIENTTRYRFEAVINGLVRSIFEFDERNFIKLYTSARNRMGFTVFIEELLYPLMDRMVLLWRKYRLSLIHQSFATEIVKMLLINEYVSNFSDTSIERVLLYSTGKDELLLTFLMVYLQLKGVNPVLLGTGLNYSKIEPALLSLRVSGVIGIGDGTIEKKDKLKSILFFQADETLRRYDLIEELEEFVNKIKRNN